MRGHFAHLKRESPYYDLFENGMCPVKGIFMTAVELEGSPEREACLVDMERLTPMQFEGLAERVAKQFGAPKEEVAREMRTNGMPIRASQVNSISSDSMWFL